MAALGSLLGSPVEVTPHSVGLDTASTLTSHTLALGIASPEDGTDPAPWWLILEIEPALVAPVVATATRRPPPRALRGSPPSPATVGSFAAILAAAVRRAGLAVTVVPLPDGVSAPQDAAIAGFSVLALGGVTHVRAFFPSSLLSAATPRWDNEALHGLGDLPLSLPLVACRLAATAAEVATVRLGDIWVLGDAWGLGPRASLRGDAVLCDPSSECALGVRLEGDGRVVLREGREEMSWSPMRDKSVPDTGLVEAIADVPVVVRVEIGIARMTAREWSGLRAGDVIGLGSKIGDPVTLRVSGLAVAEGELVDLDGEVGVRVRRRLASGAK